MSNVAVFRSPRTRNRELTRERLLDSAREAFCAQGFENTSLRDIANSVGVNHALIKYYFADKLSLWQEAVSQLMTEQHNYMNAAIADAQPKTDSDHFRAAIVAFVRYWSSRPSSARMIYWSCMQDNDRMRWLADTHLTIHNSRAIANVERWQKCGLLPRNADTLLLSYAILGVAFAPLVMASEIAHSHGVEVFSDVTIEKLIATILALLDHS